MLIKIRVKTDAKAEKTEWLDDTTLKIDVREPAQDNKANDRILEIIRNQYRNRPVKLIHGHHSPHKIIQID